MAQTIEADRFAERIQALWGDPLLEAAGVLHVTAAWRPARGPLQVIAIGAASPVSATDRFALEVSRARADVILTTGRILRQEPELQHALSREAFSWRALKLDKPRPARVVVLTSGRDLPTTHPVFEGRSETLVLSDRRGAERLRGQSFPTPPQILSRDPLDLRAAIACIRDELDARTLSIEAGPATSAALYEPPLAVDELMLSLYEMPSLDEELRAGPLPALSELERALPISSAAREIEEPSGAWSFRRLRRASSKS